MNHNHTIQRIKKVVLDPYFIATAFFSIWMLFFDYQNLFAQSRLYNRWQKLKADCVHYTFQIEQIKQEKERLHSDNRFLEQLAREKYYMKRPKEDLYIIMRG